MSDLIAKIKAYINENSIIDKGDSIVIGLSGGADSVCLFHVLYTISKEYDLKLYAVHVHHGIRGPEADRDLRFCEDICHEYGVFFNAHHFDVPAYAKEYHMTVEEAARKIRYEVFDKACEKYGAAKVAVAHHMNDQAETILFRMCRGTGIKGLTGMSAKRQNIIRPLLCVTKNEIMEYIKSNGLSYITDSTNLQEEYDRNRIRRRVISEMEEVNPAAVTHIAQTGEMLREVYDFLHESAVDFVFENVKCGENAVWVEAEAVNRLHPALKKEVVRIIIGKLTNSLKDITAEHIASVLKLVDMETGKQIHLPYEITACREYDNIKLFSNGEIEAAECDEVKFLSENEDIIFKNVYLPDEGVCIKEVTLKTSVFPYDDGENIPNYICTKWFDYDKMKSVLCFRRPNPDDFFIIKGGGRKRLTRYMIDKKVPRNYRDKLLVLADNKEVLWVVGGYMSTAGMITTETKQTMEISFERSL